MKSKQKSKLDKYIKFSMQKKVLAIIGIITALFGTAVYINNINAVNINSGDNQVNLQNSPNSTIQIKSATPNIESETFITDGKQKKFILKKSFVQYSTVVSWNGMIMTEGENAHYIENLTDHSIEFLSELNPDDTINIKYTVI
jgi:hypothetical protein